MQGDAVKQLLEEKLENTQVEVEGSYKIIVSVAMTVKIGRASCRERV